MVFFFIFWNSRSQAKGGRNISLDGDFVRDLVPVLLVVAGVLAPVNRSKLEEPQVLVVAACRAGTGTPPGGRGLDLLARGVRLRSRRGQGKEGLGERLDLAEALGGRRRGRHLDGCVAV